MRDSPAPDVEGDSGSSDGGKPNDGTEGDPADVAGDPADVEGEPADVEGEPADVEGGPAGAGDDLPPIASDRDNEFKISIKNAAGNEYQITCANNPGKRNSYNTDTITHTRADLWGCTSPKTCLENRFSLHFERVDAKNAVAGRCISADTPTFSGDGTFSTRMFSHTNVLESDGVFTVGMMPTPFDVKGELDLIVVNLTENVAKVGSPGKSKAVALDTIAKRWITVTMEKVGGTCTTQIERDGASTVKLGTSKCSTNPLENHIVITGRARNNSSSRSSFVEITDVKWVQH